MPPQESIKLSFAEKNEVLDKNLQKIEQKSQVDVTKDEWKYEYKWFNIFVMIVLHINAIYATYVALTGRAKWQTYLFAYLLYLSSGLGISAGVHRLWSHRSYKAKWPLRLALMIFNTITFQNSIYHWSREHRVHHKFTETDADPHDSRRGFWFSHCLWLVIKKRPEVTAAGRKLDFSDLDRDVFVKFQKDNFTWMGPLWCLVLPTIVPAYFWNESLLNAWLIPAILRYTVVLHITWCVNSIAHIWGQKPYNKSNNSLHEIFITLTSLGEGWHNYHHVFPWDYQASELGNYRLNFTTMFLDFMAKIGQVYDRKTVNKKKIESKKAEPGDEKYIWGWTDPDITKNDMEIIKILSKKSF